MKNGEEEAHFLCRSAKTLERGNLCMDPSDTTEVESSVFFSFFASIARFFGRE
jgi:hypothetical protein